MFSLGQQDASSIPENLLRKLYRLAHLEVNNYTSADSWCFGCCHQTALLQSLALELMQKYSI